MHTIGQRSLKESANMEMGTENSVGRYSSAYMDHQYARHSNAIWSDVHRHTRNSTAIWIRLKREVR